MMGRMTWIAVAIGFALGLSARADAQEMTLRFKFKEGEVRKFRWDSKTVISAGEMKIPLMDFSLFWEQKTAKVEAKAEGEVATVEIKFLKITGKMMNQMTGEETTFDSEKDNLADNIFLSNFTEVLGKTFPLALTALGKYATIKKEDDMGLEDPILTNVAKMMGQVNPQLPEPAVKAGAEWTVESVLSLPMLGDLNTKIKSVIEAVEGDVVKVKVEGELEVKAEEKPPGDPGEKKGEGEEPSPEEMMRPKISGGKIAGAFQFDAARGVVVKKTQKTTLKMMQMNMEMPVETDDVLELLPAGDPAKEEPKTEEPKKEEPKEEKKE